MKRKADSRVGDEVAAPGLGVAGEIGDDDVGTAARGYSHPIDRGPPSSALANRTAAESASGDPAPIVVRPADQVAQRSPATPPSVGG